MKTKFTITALSLLLVLSIVLSGCAKTEVVVTEAPKEPDADVEMYDDLKVIDVEPGAKIIFSGWGDETEQQIYRDSIVRFNEFYPDVEVDYQPIPADFQTKLKPKLVPAAMTSSRHY